jgi:UTP--glucose-1-phosphate uridylyltransferase
MVEKPKLPELEDAPSDLAVIGRYIPTPAVFETLAETKTGVGS